MSKLFQIKDLKKQFSKEGRSLYALSDIQLDIHEGETLGLVGESGCGKSTLGKLLLKLIEPTSGQISFEGENLLQFEGEELKNFRRKVSVVFQDPYASLNPRMTVEDIVAEPLEIHQLFTASERKERVKQLLELVGLSTDQLARFPHEFSGGQRQRIGIARALSINPKFLICDEPISALDVSIQAQIINLLKALQQEMGLTYLFIAHDLRVVKYISTRVAVMYLGHIVELADSEELYAKPLHPYTQALFSAIPSIARKQEPRQTRILLQGEIPSAFDVPKGCPFASRCPHAQKICHEVKPEWKEVNVGHFASCHLIP